MRHENITSAAIVHQQKSNTCKYNCYPIVQTQLKKQQNEKKKKKTENKLQEHELGESANSKGFNSNILVKILE